MDNNVNKERKFLYNLKSPEELKRLSTGQCEKLCEEIRRILIEVVSNNGGHLASNLGSVELTMALHRVFDSPSDKFVFDVGHQSYTHKILTGRAKEFETLRQKDGLCGFCRPEESVHDAFISGHSSTAVSAALGIASAMKINGDNHHAIAVVGDGAATGGEFFEGLNNAGKSNTNIVVILNYNEMSISKNVGALAKYLSTLRIKEGYHKTKTAVEKVLDKTPVVGKPIKGAIKTSKDALKGLVLHSTFFEDFGFEYIGPLDGHNLEELENGLKAAKSVGKPVLVYVETVKGKGYAPAEENPGEYHGVGSFEISTGNPDVVEADSFSSVMGKELLYLGRNDKRICAVTAAMKYGTGLQYFAKAFPSRFFDVGIAEEHAVTFCGGLASMGCVPVFAVYSTFLQRTCDQIIHDLAICKTHAVLCVDRAGVVGNDGETHQGIFDVSILTAIPNTTIYSPSNYEELRLCLKKAIDGKEIQVVRYPRGNDKSVYEKKDVNTEYSLCEKGGKILLVTYGRLFNNVYKACEILEEKNITVDTLKLVKIFPVQEEIKEIISRYDKVIFFEESYIYGSVGEKYSALCKNTVFFGIDGFVTHGDRDILLDETGLSPEKIAEKTEEIYNAKT